VVYQPARQPASAACPGLRFVMDGALVTDRGGRYMGPMFRHLIQFLERHPALLLAIPPLFWAGNHVIGRAVAGEIPPAGLAVVRWAFAVLALLPFAWPHLVRDAALVRSRLGTLTFLALTGAGIFGTLQFVALQYTKALTVAVMNSVAPAFILAASFLIFRDRISSMQAGGIIVSIGGVLVIVSRGDLGALSSLELNGGDLLVVVNMMLWAVYSACLRLRPNVHPLTFMLVLSAISGLANIGPAIVEHLAGLPLPLTGSMILAALYVGLGTSVLSYIAWTRGVELVGAPRAAAFLHLVPIFGAILAWLFLGEQLALFHVAGFALILCGVSLAARRGRVPVAPASPVRTP